MLISIVIFPTSQPITTCSASKWTVSLVQKGFTVKPWRLQQYLQSQKRQVSGMKRVGGLDCFAVFPLQPKWCFLHFGERDTILKEVKKLDMCVSNNLSRCQSWNGQKKVSVWSFFKHHFKRSTCNHDPTLVMEGWIDSIDGPQVQVFQLPIYKRPPKTGASNGRSSQVPIQVPPQRRPHHRHRQCRLPQWCRKLRQHIPRQKWPKKMIKIFEYLITLNENDEMRTIDDSQI